MDQNALLTGFQLPHYQGEHVTFAMEYLYSCLKTLYLQAFNYLMPRHSNYVPSKVTCSQPLEADQGLLREALTSLYNLFPVTRQVLKEAGPDVGASHDSVGRIGIAVLNNGSRPVLAKWHPLLQTWEAQRLPNLSPKEHECKWAEEGNLRAESEGLRKDLELYAQALATIAGVGE